jgi:hypothetical protein
MFKKLLPLLFLFAGFQANAALLGHWTGDTNALDSTGTYNGTLQGNAGYSSGLYNQAFRFDGNGDSVLLSSNPNVTNGFTIAAWVNPLSHGTENQIFNNESSYQLAVRGGTLQFAIETDAPGSWFWIDSGLNVSTSSWAFYALSYDGTTSKIFDDLGTTLYTSGLVSGNILSSSNQTHIGSRNNDNSSFNGLIDDVWLFDEALNTPDIALVALGAHGQSQPMPEPSIIALMGIGLAGIGFASRRRKVQS